MLKAGIRNSSKLDPVSKFLVDVAKPNNTE